MAISTKSFITTDFNTYEHFRREGALEQKIRDLENRVNATKVLADQIVQGPVISDHMRGAGSADCNPKLLLLEDL